MLWRLFVCLILGGFIASCSCEPVNRKLLQTSDVDECAGNEGDISTCNINRTAIASSSNRRDQTRIGRKKHFTDNEEISEVSARGKKNKKGYGRIIFLMIAAMKGALIYGLLHGVAALAGKAVLVAKIALAIAIAALIKKNGHESVSYEIVKHPHTSYVQTHSSSIDYDHRSDYGEELDYNHRNRKRRHFFDRDKSQVS
ncbi:uncharacterized protein LOC109855119 [Pseudomyrmex gracilis]|uniref:uncharacterized protein LOC109855119 n=1 Tax=Pseudomyrmex gracilis TaxID=219809 RepID=UPI000995B719|nr:uncharacterized protein LOC109855119 [Pseudomyrmex gracilis]